MGFFPHYFSAIGQHSFVTVWQILAATAEPDFNLREENNVIVTNIEGSICFLNAHKLFPYGNVSGVFGHTESSLHI